MTTETLIKTENQIRVAPPRMWKVVFLNDDSTSMDLVIDLLKMVFNHNQDNAEKIAMEVHESGSGIAGVYTYEIAEHRSIEATNIARANGAPLKIRVEED